jgi:hypothetical protein
MAPPLRVLFFAQHHRRAIPTAGASWNEAPPGALRLVTATLRFMGHDLIVVSTKPAAGQISARLFATDPAIIRCSTELHESATYNFGRLKLIEINSMQERIDCPFPYTFHCSIIRPQPIGRLQ